MRAEDLWEWLREHRAEAVATEADMGAEGETSGSEESKRATKEGKADRGEERYPNKWEKVAEIVQLPSQDGIIAEEAACQAVVLISKGGGDNLSIGLVEVIWKAVAVILNRRFTAVITYHNLLHRLWAGRGTGTANLEVKLLQQVAALREAVLSAICMDLHKAYDALDKSR